MLFVRTLQNPHKKGYTQKESKLQAAIMVAESYTKILFAG